MKILLLVSLLATSAIARRTDRGGLEEIHRVIRARRDCQDRAGARAFRRGRTRGDGRHDHSLAGIARRADRSLSGIHRHDQRRDSQDEAADLGRSDAKRARAVRRRHVARSWLQQYLRAGHATERSGPAWDQEDQRSAGASGVEGGTDARIPRPPGRLAAVARALWPNDAERQRDRSRHRLRRAREWIDRSEGRVFHRRKNRGKRSRGSRRTISISSRNTKPFISTG